MSRLAYYLVAKKDKLRQIFAVVPAQKMTSPAPCSLRLTPKSRWVSHFFGIFESLILYSMLTKGFSFCGCDRPFCDGSTVLDVLHYFVRGFLA
jgi:hypothetical protein